MISKDMDQAIKCVKEQTQILEDEIKEQEQKEGVVEVIETQMDSLKQAFDTLEGSVKQLESKMEHVNEAIELIKTYGFQPRQFEELLRIQRGLNSDDTAALKQKL